MSRKPKRPKHKESLTTSVSPADKLFDLIGLQMHQGDYAGVIANSERLLSYLPQRTPQRAEVLAQLGVAHGMLQNPPQSYAAFTEALEITPNNAQLWFNRGMASHFTSRFGRSLRDYERAAELNTLDDLAGTLTEELKESRELAKEAIEMRGPNFTLDQLIEQEELFQRGLQRMGTGNWQQAGQNFQAAIAMDDCLPQPWGNLGICFMMQERYDEAQAAFEQALVIDPTYALAKSNLAALPEARRTGPPKTIGFENPFKDSKLKQSIIFMPKSS